MQNSNDLNQPMTEPTYYILLSLAPQPLHGYAILKDVRRLSEERVKLSTGTLYGAIKRLLEQGWIEPVANGGGEHPGKERRTYAITQGGRRALEAELLRMKHLMSAARLQLAGDGR